jgi:hypothetical protein
MKAVIYHADGPIAKNFPPDTYCKLFEGFKKNAAEFGLDTIHLTLEGHPGWGDENYYFPNLDPADIVYNREICFIEFLKSAPDDVYWFSEPDSRIAEMWPPLEGDIAMLRRQDEVAITPAWRLARPSALPIFEMALERFDTNQKLWHGDSVAFRQLWLDFNQPDIGHFEYNGTKIELRNYSDYCRVGARYTRQWKAGKKLRLLGEGQ